MFGFPKWVILINSGVKVQNLVSPVIPGQPPEIHGNISEKKQDEMDRMRIKTWTNFGIGGDTWATKRCDFGTENPVSPTKIGFWILNQQFSSKLLDFDTNLIYFFG